MHIWLIVHFRSNIFFLLKNDFSEGIICSVLSLGILTYARSIASPFIIPNSSKTENWTNLMLESPKLKYSLIHSRMNYFRIKPIKLCGRRLGHHSEGGRFSIQLLICGISDIFNLRLLRFGYSSSIPLPAMRDKYSYMAVYCRSGHVTFPLTKWPLCSPILLSSLWRKNGKSWLRTLSLFFSLFSVLSVYHR